MPLAAFACLYGASDDTPKGRFGPDRRETALSQLDFTQNLEEATDAITLGRRHSWLESEGFSLSAANADVQELPATLYH